MGMQCQARAKHHESANFQCPSPSTFFSLGVDVSLNSTLLVSLTVTTSIVERTSAVIYFTIVLVSLTAFWPLPLFPSSIKIHHVYAEGG